MSSDGEEAVSTKNLDFGNALRFLEKGARVFRQGWHLAGMYLQLQRPDANSANTLPYIYIVLPGYKGQTGEEIVAQRVPWTASQTDLLSNDWEVITE